MGGVWVQDYCRQSHFRNLRVSSEAARFVRDLYFQKLSGFVLISTHPRRWARQPRRGHAAGCLESCSVGLSYSTQPTV